MQLDFTAIFNAYAVANSREFKHDRSQSVGASESFDCIRKVWFRKVGHAHGFEPDVGHSQSWGASERGNLLENEYVVPAMHGHLPDGALLLFAGDEQQTLFSGQNSATPDGIIVGLARDALQRYGIDDIKSDCVMFEIKSIDPRVALHEEKSVHRGQTQVQMGIVRETTNYKPHYAVILYVNASFLDDIKVFVVEFDEQVWKAAQHRAAQVFDTTNPAKLLPEGKFDRTCEHCQFKSACAMVQTGSVPVDNSKLVTSLLREELDPVLRKYREMQQASKDAAHAFEEVKEELKEALREAGTRKAGEKGVWSVSWYTQKGTKSLDREKIADALGVANLDDFTKQGEAFDVLKVSFSD